MEDIIELCGWDGRTLTWVQLAEEAEVYGISQRSIRRIMQARGYYVCKACKKTWIDEDLAPRRKKWAVDMLKKYPTKESW